MIAGWRRSGVGQLSLGHVWDSYVEMSSELQLKNGVGAQARTEPVNMYLVSAEYTYMAADT